MTVRSNALFKAFKHCKLPSQVQHDETWPLVLFRAIQFTTKSARSVTRPRLLASNALSMSQFMTKESVAVVQPVGDAILKKMKN